MAEYDNEKWKRSLPFPLGDSEYPEHVEPASGVAPNVTPDFFPYDEPDTLIDLHFKMSMSQFTAIASAIDIGRDIGFGERSYELWRTWCKALIGEITVNCEDIAECIESELTTNIDLQNSVAITVNESGFGNPNSVNPTLTKLADRNDAGYQDEEIGELSLECDLNQLWGGIRYGIVERLDEAARDLLEDLALIPDIAERLIVFADIVPVIGDLAEGLAFQVSEVVPDLQNLFNSHSSLEVLDEIACDLFSMVCADCRYPTMGEVLDYYFSRSLGGVIAGSATLETLAQALVDVITGSASVAYFTIVSWELWILNAQATFAGLNGGKAISRMVELGEDFGNDNWQTLCDGCNENYAILYYDFKQSTYNSYPTAGGGFAQPQGTWFAGQGWRADKIGSGLGAGNFCAYIGIPFNSAHKVRAIAWKTSVPRTEFAAQIGTQLRPNPRSATAANILAMGSGTDNHVSCKDGLASITNVQEIQLYASTGLHTFYIEEMIVIIDRDGSLGKGTPTADSTACDNL